MVKYMVTVDFLVNRWCVTRAVVEVLVGEKESPLTAAYTALCIDKEKIVSAVSKKIVEEV